MVKKEAIMAESILKSLAKVGDYAKTEPIAPSIAKHGELLSFYEDRLYHVTSFLRTKSLPEQHSLAENVQ